MKTSCIKLLATILLLSLCSCHTVQTSAQSHIDKIVAQIEKKNNVEKSVVKKRDPKTGDLVRHIESYSFKDDKLSQELIDAFEKDENDATKSAINRSKNNFSYVLIFHKGKIITSYYLSNAGGYTILNIIRKKDDDSSYISFPQYNNYSYYDFNGRNIITSDSLGNLLMNKNELRNLNKKIEKASKEFAELFEKYMNNYNYTYKSR